MKRLKIRLTVINFLQFFIWGTYLTSIGGYMYATLQFKGGEIGTVFLTLGIASVFMPPLMGVISDKWIPAQKLLGIMHIAGAGALLYASTVTTAFAMFWAMLLVCICYMPTISLNNTVSYCILKNNGMAPQKDFPPIRVWGTIGFIIGMWLTDLFHFTLSKEQLIFAGISSLCTGFYCFTLPSCKPANKKSLSLSAAFGLDALKLFGEAKMAIFLIFSIFLGVALQITNQWAIPFIDHFKSDPRYADAIAVKYPNILVSISQMSETLFIVAIPFFLKRYGIKIVMLLSMFAWCLRFMLLGLGDPGGGLMFLILSMIVYGLAFDFFNISGSLFIEKEAPAAIRGSAQGLFMMMTNGIGAMIGSYGSGWLVEQYTQEGTTHWQTVWFIFGGYALVIAVLFALIFRYKHNTDVSYEKQLSHS